MKVSVITVCYNSAETIADALQSVASQTHPDIEHIVIDGASLDGTMRIVDRYRAGLTTVVSEPDRGIYDAMNKGLRIASGDIVGFLNSDDYYTRKDVVERIASAFAQPQTEAVFGDVQFVDPQYPQRIVRRYSSRHFRPDRIGWGWIPAHPTLFFRRSVYARHGEFKTDFRIAGDYEFIARVFTRNVLRYEYLPEVLVTMRTGGVSTGGLRATLLLNQEVLRACRMNGIRSNYLKLGLKYAFKLMELSPRIRRHAEDAGPPA